MNTINEIIKDMDNNNADNQNHELEMVQPDLLGYISNGNRKLSDCSTSSVTAPSKTPKKVSFSDELPGSDIVTDDTNSKIQSPMEYVLQQNSDYLNDLHRSAIKGADEIDEVGHLPVMNDTAIFPIQRKESLHSDKIDSTYILKSSVILEDATADQSVELAAKSATEITEKFQTNLKARDDDIEKIVCEMKNGNRQRLHNSDIHHRALDDVHCSSAMEMEVRRDKKRWLLISECSVLLGDERHTREGFRKEFLDHVSLTSHLLFQICKYRSTTHISLPIELITKS